MKLLLDMNVSPKLVALLLGAGLDARHWSDAGLPSAEDTSIAEFALEHGTVVVTHDLDFGALLARTGQGRPSVIQIRADDLSVVQLADMLVLLCRDFGPELEVGALVTLDLRSTRIRSLPIHQ